MAPRLPVQAAAVERSTLLDTFLIAAEVRDAGGHLVQLKLDQPGGSFASLPGDPASFSPTRMRAIARYATVRRGPA